MNLKYSMPLSVLVLSLGAGAALVARQSAPAADEALMKKARAIHERVLTVDTHVDIGGAELRHEGAGPRRPYEAEVRPAEDEGRRP